MTRPTLNRRRLLQAGVATLAPSLGWAAVRRFEPQVGPWRSFEVTTSVTVAEPQGGCKVWLPVPELDNDFQQSLEHAWSGNASAARLVSEREQGVRMLYAEFAAGTVAPSVVLTSRVRTRNRAVDWQRTGAAKEDPDVLRAALAPTPWIPLDGIVARTAHQATRGAAGDVAKVRAIYDWVVSSAYRNTQVRGCGSGDVKAMLESGNLGGKCADLNAVFVGLCRASGVPARDIYGLRLAPSAFGYHELGANPANLKGAQHCRAEVFLKRHGWVAMDPADVLKVMRQESPEWIKDARHALVAPVKAGLFGGWEGNWVGWNHGHDVTLPGSAGKSALPFLMYPNGENASGRFDELAADAFRYTISAHEVAG